MIGSKIKKIRTDLRFSQEEMAEKLEVSKNTLSNYERGKRKPDSVFIQKLVSQFNVNTSWLFKGIGSIFIDSPFPDSGEIDLDRFEEFLNLVTDKAIEYKKIQTSIPNISDISSIPEIDLESYDFKSKITEEDILSHKCFENAFLKYYENPILITIKTDSMSPQVLPGDLILVDRNEKHLKSNKFKGYYLVNNYNESKENPISVRKVVKSDGEIILIPLNPKYEDFRYTFKNEASIKKIIMGKCVWIGRILND